jgi:hypothetical protein
LDPQWQTELQMLMDPEIDVQLKRYDIRLCSFADLFEGKYGFFKIIVYNIHMSNPMIPPGWDPTEMDRHQETHEIRNEDVPVSLRDPEGGQKPVSVTINLANADIHIRIAGLLPGLANQAKDAFHDKIVTGMNPQGILHKPAEETDVRAATGTQIHERTPELLKEALLALERRRTGNGLLPY